MSCIDALTRAAIQHARGAGTFRLHSPLVRDFSFDPFSQERQ